MGQPTNLPPYALSKRQPSHKNKTLNPQHWHEPYKKKLKGPPFTLPYIFLFLHCSILFKSPYGFYQTIQVSSHDEEPQTQTQHPKLFTSCINPWPTPLNPPLAPNPLLIHQALLHRITTQGSRYRSRAKVFVPCLQPHHHLPRRRVEAIGLLLHRARHLRRVHRSCTEAQSPCESFGRSQ